MHTRIGLRVIIGILSSVALAACATSGGAEVVIDAEPRALPTAKLMRVDAELFQGVVAGFRGRPVVVNVWASWCGPCRVEAPLLDRAATEYGDDVVFLGVASRDDRDGAEGFLLRYDIDYPNVFDEDGSVRRFLGLRGFPTTYVFDRQGSLTAAEVGGITEQVLAARIEDALRT